MGVRACGRGAQPDGLWAEADRPVVDVGRPVGQRDIQRHGCGRSMCVGVPGVAMQSVARAGSGSGGEAGAVLVRAVPAAWAAAGSAAGWPAAPVPAPVRPRARSAAGPRYVPARRRGLFRSGLPGLADDTGVTCPLGRRHRCRHGAGRFRRRGDLHHRARHGDEEHAHVAAGMHLAVLVLRIDVQHLAALERLADGDDHPPVRLQLLEQLRRGVLCRTGHDDDVEPALAPPASRNTRRPRGCARWCSRSGAKILCHRMAQRLDDLDRVGAYPRCATAGELWKPLPVPISSDDRRRAWACRPGSCRPGPGSRTGRSRSRAPQGLGFSS